MVAAGGIVMVFRSLFAHTLMPLPRFALRTWKLPTTESFVFARGLHQTDAFPWKTGRCDTAERVGQSA